MNNLRKLICYSYYFLKNVIYNWKKLDVTFGNNGSKMRTLLMFIKSTFWYKSGPIIKGVW